MKLKVLSFNLNLLPALSFMFLSGQGYENQRLQEFIPYLEQYDVILLQEVFSSPFVFPTLLCRQRKLRIAAAERGFKYIVRGPQPSVVDLVQERKWTDGGLLILSRYRVEDRDAITFEVGTDVDKGASKGCIFAKIKIGDTSLMIFNCHLQATHTLGSKSCSTIRQQQLSEVRRFIQTKVHENPTCPWILGGDFNCDAISNSVSDSIGIEAREAFQESDEYKIMINVIDPTRRIKDLLKLRYGYHPSTRPPREVIRGGIRGIFKHKYPQRLDYLFYCNASESNPEGIELKPLSEETDVVTFQNSSEALPFDYLSDHYGVETSLQYSQNLTKTMGTVSYKTLTKERLTSSEKKKYSLLSVCLGILLGILVIRFNIFTFLLLCFVISAFFIDYPAKIKRWTTPKTKSKPPSTSSYLRLSKETPKSGEGVSHLPAIANCDELNDVRTLYENFIRGVKKFSHKPCLGYKAKMNQPFRWLTYDDVHRRVRNFGSGLINLGFTAGTKVAIYSENRPEWVICEQACNAYHFISVPLYDAGPSFVEDVLACSGVTVVVCSRIKCHKILEILKKNRSKFKVKTVIQMQRIRYEEYALGVDARVQLIPFEFIETDGIFNAHRPRPPTPTDIASIMFSYQAKGSIKGITLTHSNIVNMAKSLFQAHMILGETVTDRDRHFSYFPLARMFERTVVTLMLHSGASIAFKHIDSRFFEETSEVKPTFLYCIPTDFTKLYGKYKIALMSWSKTWAWIFHTAFKMKKRAIVEQNNKKIGLLDRLFFSKYAAHMGGKLRFIMVSSEGNLPQIHQEFLQIIFCCKVAQCYIRTEMGVSTCTTGNPGEGAGFPLCEMKLVDVPEFKFSSFDNGGEIAVRGESITKGYFNNEELTAKRIQNGWFLTGEIGKWNADGSITILGHKEEVLEPVSGEYIFARHLEFTYSQSSFVHQIFICSKPYKPLVAVIVPDYEVTVRWAKENQIKEKFEPNFLYRNDQVKAAVLHDLNTRAIQAKLRDSEYIAAVYLATEEIPSLISLQRNQLWNQFEDVVEAMYLNLAENVPLPTQNPKWKSAYGDLNTSRLFNDEMDNPSNVYLLSWRSGLLLVAICIIYHVSMFPRA